MAQFTETLWEYKRQISEQSPGLGLGQEQILNDNIGAMLQFHSLDSLLQMPFLMSVQAR